ncbi:MAG: YabP/YqfC family sporulation protein [Oscillospiraceae bacterium]|nr:YabP/YqfC family sporulation protein [Oscillospiraceae bacterium]
MSKQSFIVRAADLFDVPADARGGLMHIEMTGNREVYVENHKGILELSETEVKLNMGKGSVKVSGNGLAVLAMNAEEVRLSGVIEGISFEV